MGFSWTTNHFFFFLFPLGEYTKYIYVYEKRSLQSCCNAAPVCICIAEAISLSRSSRRMSAHCAQFWAAADSVRCYRSDPFCPSLFQFTPCPHPPAALSWIYPDVCVCVLCVLLAAASQAHPIVSSPPFSYFSLYLSISLSLATLTHRPQNLYLIFILFYFLFFSNAELTHTAYRVPLRFTFLSRLDFLLLFVAAFICVCLRISTMRSGVCVGIRVASWGSDRQQNPRCFFFFPTENKTIQNVELRPCARSAIYAALTLRRDVVPIPPPISVTHCFSHGTFSFLFFHWSFYE
jgi:hypothetical protein